MSGRELVDPVGDMAEQWGDSPLQVSVYEGKYEVTLNLSEDEEKISLSVKCPARPSAFNNFIRIMDEATLKHCGFDPRCSVAESWELLSLALEVKSPSTLRVKIKPVMVAGIDAMWTQSEELRKIPEAPLETCNAVIFSLYELQVTHVKGSEVWDEYDILLVLPPQSDIDRLMLEMVNKDRLLRQLKEDLLDKDDMIEDLKRSKLRLESLVREMQATISDKERAIAEMKVVLANPTPPMHAAMMAGGGSFRGAPPPGPAPAGFMGGPGIMAPSPAGSPMIPYGRSPAHSVSSVGSSGMSVGAPPFQTTASQRRLISPMQSPRAPPGVPPPGAPPHSSPGGGGLPTRLTRAATVSGGIGSTRKLKASGLPGMGAAHSAAGYAPPSRSPLAKPGSLMPTAAQKGIQFTFNTKMAGGDYTKPELFEVTDHKKTAKHLGGYVNILCAPPLDVNRGGVHTCRFRIRVLSEPLRIGLIGSEKKNLPLINGCCVTNEGDIYLARSVVKRDVFSRVLDDGDILSITADLNRHEVFFAVDSRPDHKISVKWERAKTSFVYFGFSCRGDRGGSTVSIL